MTFDDRAFEFIAWAQPLSDPRKARITVKQLLNHTSGICPEATGAPIDGKWDFILGHTDDARTASLAFDPGTGVVTRHFVGRRGRCFAGMDLMISRPFALAG
jgi:CubicO group peptidase (beta-lactamase class C family)